MCTPGRTTVFAFDKHRQSELYGRITGQVGAAEPPVWENSPPRLFQETTASVPSAGIATAAPRRPRLRRVASTWWRTFFYRYDLASRSAEAAQRRRHRVDPGGTGCGAIGIDRETGAMSTIVRLWKPRS